MQTTTRNGAMAGIVAGLGYLIQAVMGLVKPQTEFSSGTFDYFLEAATLAAARNSLGPAFLGGGILFGLAWLGVGYSSMKQQEQKRATHPGRSSISIP